MQRFVSCRVRRHGACRVWEETSADFLSLADGSLAASFWYVGMLFLNSSTHASRFGRSLHSKVDLSSGRIAGQQLQQVYRPIFLYLVVMNRLRIVYVDIQLRQRKLARVQVFELDRHSACAAQLRPRALCASMTSTTHNKESPQARMSRSTTTPVVAQRNCLKLVVSEPHAKSLL